MFKKQYGYDIDDGSDVLCKTRLELEDPNDRLRELRTFSDTLYGISNVRLQDTTAIDNEIPEHLSKNAEDIIEDYLTKIAEVVHHHIQSHLGKHILDQGVPIDMVVTHPGVSMSQGLVPYNVMAN